MSTFTGESIRLTIFGASHAPEIGMTLEGIPAGKRIEREPLIRFLERRAPGRNAWTTARREPDEPEFRSGLASGSADEALYGITDGTPLTAVIRNKDAHSADYEAIRFTPRPGHADYTAYVKYGGAMDMTGGGPFSGRMTAPFAVAGGILLQLLAEEGIRVMSRIAQIGTVKDRGDLTEQTAEKPFPTVDREAGEAMLRAIAEAKADGDSLGGIVECAVTGLPAGLGGPLFDGVESRLGALLFGIPAVKGVSFGEGFGAASMRGSEHNDAFCIAEDGTVRTETNHAGGILGGITTGMPLRLCVAFKPTPSIAKEQRTVDLRTLTETAIRVPGRHDPCIVPRAVPVVEAAAAVALYDALSEQKRTAEERRNPERTK